MKSKSFSLEIQRQAILALCVLLNGCRTSPPTLENIEGHYQVHEEAWTSCEVITLHKGNFSWECVTGRKDGPHPINGTYTLNRHVLTLHNPLMSDPTRVITRDRRGCIMWTLKEYDEFRRTGQTPVTVLYQSR